MDHVLKKWKKLAISSNSNSSTPNGKKKSTNYLKKKTVLSFSFSSSSSSSISSISSSNNACSSSSSSSSSSDMDGVWDVPKGSLAVCVGEEMKRFVIPTEYLRHRAFGALLREAEEEYGFEQEGVLRIPCGVAVFERVLKTVEEEEEEEFCCGDEAENDEMIYPTSFSLLRR